MPSRPKARKVLSQKRGQASGTVANFMLAPLPWTVSTRLGAGAPQDDVETVRGSLPNSPVFCLIKHVALCLACPSAASGKGRLKGTAGAKVIGTQQGTITNSIQDIGLPGFKVD